MKHRCSARVTRSGDFARKTHFKIFFRAQKLVSRAKREKRYFGRFLSSKFIYIKTPSMKENLEIFSFFILIFVSLATLFLVTFCFSHRADSAFRQNFSFLKLLFSFGSPYLLFSFFVRKLFAKFLQNHTFLEKIVNKSAIKHVFLQVLVFRAFQTGFSRFNFIFLRLSWRFLTPYSRFLGSKNLVTLTRSVLRALQNLVRDVHQSFRVGSPSRRAFVLAVWFPHAPKSRPGPALLPAQDDLPRLYEGGPPPPPSPLRRLRRGQGQAALAQGDGGASQRHRRVHIRVRRVSRSRRRDRSAILLLGGQVCRFGA